MNPISKICSQCNEEKFLELFYKHKLGKYGRKASCIECESISNKTRYDEQKNSGLTYIKNKKENVRKSNFRNKFGITVQQYEELLEKQEYKCAVCEKHQDEFKTKFAVDHSHSDNGIIPKNAIRGLLCKDCNLNLISHRVDPNIFERAANYVRQYTGLIAPERSTID